MTTLSPITASPASLSTPSNAASMPLPNMAGTNAAPTSAPVAKPKTSRPRKRVNTAEKRSQHNAIERARRETLNGKFLSLANLLPSLATSRRPSKSAIVNGSIAHVSSQRKQRLLAASLLRQVCAERDELLDEVNRWRKANGCAVKDGASAWTEEMDEIASVEQEVFGSFASMGEDGDDDEGLNELSDQATQPISATISTNNGLFTPRLSADLDAAMAQQALFTSAPVHETRTAHTAGINGNSWSADFTFDISNVTGPTAGMSFPNGFLGDAQSSSPVTSNQCSAIVTPPAMSELMYTHTPSPASSNGLSMSAHSGEVKIEQTGLPSAPSGPWTPGQFAFIQQQVQQAQQLRLQQAQLATRQHLQQPFNPIAGNSFNALFGQQLHTGTHGHQQQQQAGNSMMQTDAFTQSLVANLFPQHGRSAAGAGAVTMEDIQNAVRTGMGLGFGLANNGTNAWVQPQNPPVEGF